MASSINKWLGKSTGLQAVLDKQKSIQECMVKLNPCRTNVSAALLKWSMTESNLSLFDAFSSWADLDHALVQLSQAVIDQNFAFRQTFKNIQGEQKRLADLQKDTDNASKKVNALVSKLDSARKAKKVDAVRVENLEAELMLAKGKEKEMISILESKAKDFEYYKGKCVKDILNTLSEAYVQCLEKSLQIWNAKLQIAKAMADEPVYHGENLETESHLKVSNLFSQLSLELPIREDAPDMKHRTLPAQPPGSSSPALRHIASVPAVGNKRSPRVPDRRSEGDSYQWEVPKESSEDEEDYAFPDQIPDDHGEVYLVPGAAEDSKHPTPPGTPPQTSSDEMGGTDSTESSAQHLGADKTSSLNRGIKVLPAGGTMKGTNPLLKDSSQEQNTDVWKRTGRKTPPPSPPPLKNDGNNPQMYTNHGVDSVKRFPPTTKVPDRPITKKPAVRPKPPTLTKKLSSQNTSKESLQDIDEDEHEYSDVPIEPDTDSNTSPKT
ncbi:hypothetical protein HOLleu_28067 [Holothuria leucospilota]|uniref:Uncharacterized protein n=1 Tax=Holothuria leucospilota TaxID=206669 RepID=A0A9Q1BRI8_HOLLE|nr:hypothetical protein HOLleu_28067 [Holothuria leucospilota]